MNYVIVKVGVLLRNSSSNFSLISQGNNYIIQAYNHLIRNSSRGIDAIIMKFRHGV